jgi:hypothetical protein
MSRVWNVAHDTDARRRVFLLDATYSGLIGTPTLAAIDGRQRLRPGFPSRRACRLGRRATR